MMHVWFGLVKNIPKFEQSTSYHAYNGWESKSIVVKGAMDG